MALADYFQTNEIFSIDRDLDLLKNIFWTKSIEQISKVAIHHITLAYAKLDMISVIHNKNFIKQKLDNLTNAARRAVNESKAAKEFIKEFE